MTLDTAVRPTTIRYLVIAALAAGTILAYLLRVCISPAGTTIQSDLTIANDVMGGIYSAFFLGYFWFQIPGGWLGNKVGARIWLSLLGLIWAGATIVTASADSANVIYWSRVALGLAQAGFFPVVIMAIREWFPVDRRGFASSIITACMSVGALLATAMTTRLLDRYGWRDTFFVYSAMGAAWSVWFLLWFRNSPRLHRRVNQAEIDLIEQRNYYFEKNIGNQNENIKQIVNVEARKTTTSVKTPRIQIYDRTKSTKIFKAQSKLGDGSDISPLNVLKALLFSPGMWALCAQTFFQSFSYALFITWYPSYLEKGRGLTVTQAGDAATANLFMEVVGSILGGILIDRIYRRTGSKWKSRSLMPAVTLAICSLFTAAAVLFASPLPAIVLVSLGMFFTGLGKTGKWACTIDLASGHTALAFAIMNMAGNVGAWLSPKVVGDMFKKLAESGGDWNQFLWLVAIIQMAAAISCFLLNPDKPAIGSGD